MLLDRHFVALPFVVLVPLIVVVEDQRYQVVEAANEPVWYRGIDQIVEPAVEIREVVKPGVYILEQRNMLSRMLSSLGHSGESPGKAAKALADRNSNISRISNSSTANSVVKPLNSHPAFGFFSIRPKC
jgi:hypothetical protein